MVAEVPPMVSLMSLARLLFVKFKFTSQVFIILNLNGILLNLVYCERPLNRIPLRILDPFNYVGSIY